MSYANFKPTVWSKFIEKELKKITVFKQDCDFKFEGEAKKGERLKILGVGRPTIKKYIPNSDIDGPETPQDTSVYLDVDQFDYFNYYVDNIDKAQSIEGLMPALQEEATRALAEAEDTYCAEQIAKNAGKIFASAQIDTADKAITAVDKAFVELWNNGVTTKDKVTMYVSPWFYNLFKSKLIDLKTANDNLIKDGILGYYNSAAIKMTNNIYNNGTDDHIIIKTSRAFAYANGIDQLVPYSPEKRFGDAVKGLNTYGSKMVRPKEAVVIKAHL